MITEGIIRPEGEAARERSELEGRKIYEAGSLDEFSYFPFAFLKWFKSGFSFIFLMLEANQHRLYVGVHFSYFLCSLLLAAPRGSRTSASCIYFAPVSI